MSEKVPIKPKSPQGPAGRDFIVNNTSSSRQLCSFAVLFWSNNFIKAGWSCFWSLLHMNQLSLKLKALITLPIGGGAKRRGG